MNAQREYTLLIVASTALMFLVLPSYAGMVPLAYVGLLKAVPRDWLPS